MAARRQSWHLFVALPVGISTAEPLSDLLPEFLNDHNLAKAAKADYRRRQGNRNRRQGRSGIRHWM